MCSFCFLHYYTAVCGITLNYLVGGQRRAEGEVGHHRKAVHPDDAGEDVVIRHAGDADKGDHQVIAAPADEHGKGE